MPTDYTLMDASLEILLMLLAAFLLGWLFCWILKKIFGKSTPKTKLKGAAASATASADLNAQASTPRSGLSASARERLYDKEHGLSKPDIDASIPTVNTKLDTPDLDLPTGNVDLDVDANVTRPRIDIPDLNAPDAGMPDLNIKGKLDAGLDAGKGGIGKGLGAAAAGLGAITAGASALKDKAVDGVSNVDLPDVSGTLDSTLESGKGLLDKGTGAIGSGVDSIGAGAASLKDKVTGGIDLPDVSGALDSTLESGKGLLDKGTDAIGSGVEAGKGGIGKGLGAAAAGLGAITAGASALKDKAVDGVSNVDLPDVSGTLDSTLESGKGLLDKGTDAIGSGVGSIGEGAASLKDKVTGGIDLPNVDLPDASGALDSALESGKGLLDKGTEAIGSGVEAGTGGIGKGLGAAAAGLGAITAGASALKDKAVDGVGSIGEGASSLTDKVTGGVDLPDIDLPDASGALDSTLESGKGLLDKGTDAIGSGVEAGKSGLGAGFGAAAASLGAVAAGAASLKGQAADVSSLTPPDLPHNQDSQNFGVSASSGASDLTRISGIDAPVAALLSQNGINSYQDIQNTDAGTLKSYLDNSGNSAFADIEPASWPQQAKLCSEQNWDKLGEYQSFLSGNSATSATPSVEETSLNKDDLKKIEGIGPFFESLLNKSGITTFAQLKESNRDTLKEIIDSAGPDYRLHEPETWPYQAGLADRGEWKKLQDYIHFMTGKS